MHAHVCTCTDIGFEKEKKKKKHFLYMKQLFTERHAFAHVSCKSNTLQCISHISFDAAQGCHPVANNLQKPLVSVAPMEHTKTLLSTHTNEKH